MSCSNLDATCDGKGNGACYSGCCDVNCPPEGLCSAIELVYHCKGAYAPDPCPEVTSSSFNFLNFLKRNANIFGKKKPNFPSFNLNQEKLSNSKEFIFAQEGGCSIPCYSLSITVSTNNSCGIATDGTVGGSKCCCSCEGGKCKVYASGGGGSCEARPSWTEREVEDGESVGLPSIIVGNDCCSCFEVKKVCYPINSLWIKRKVESKIQLILNKKEFINRANKLKKYRISRRNRKIR